MKDSFAALVETISKIDGVGAKSALRIAYDLAFVNKPLASQLKTALNEALISISECSICGAIASAELCDECLNPYKDPTIALVSSAKDILYIKKAGGFEGRFFVLVAANEHYLSKLSAMIERFNASELLLAHSPGVGADALCFYLENRFKNIKISKIASGVPQGIRLSDIDPNTLAQALAAKVNANNL